MADPNICIRVAMRPYECYYYEMILVYVDDINFFSYLGDDVAIQISNFCNIKEGSQGPHTRYLGADTDKIQTEDSH